MQPPSGGCVLKPEIDMEILLNKCFAAAFGRLCVETPTKAISLVGAFAAAFGRLCVETR